MGQSADCAVVIIGGGLCGLMLAIVYQGSRAVMAIRLEAVLSGLGASGYAAPAQVEIVAIAERKAGALLVTADPSLYNERGRLIALAATTPAASDLRNGVCMLSRAAY